LSVRRHRKHALPVEPSEMMYQLHPEIANDPVYAAALRLFHVNVGTDIDHHRMYVENGPEVDLICRRILDDDRGSGPVRPGRKRAASSSSDGLRRAASSEGGGRGRGRRERRPREEEEEGTPAQEFGQRRRTNEGRRGCVGGGIRGSCQCVMDVIASAFFRRGVGLFGGEIHTFRAISKLLR